MGRFAAAVCLVLATVALCEGQIPTFDECKATFDRVGEDSLQSTFTPCALGNSPSQTCCRAISTTTSLEGGGVLAGCLCQQQVIDGFISVLERNTLAAAVGFDGAKLMDVLSMCGADFVGNNGCVQEPETPDAQDEPDEPEESGEPDEPGKPEEPEAADELGEPGEPEEPEEPDEPGEPEEAEEPGEPDEPVEPEEEGALQEAPAPAPGPFLGPIEPPTALPSDGGDLMAPPSDGDSPLPTPLPSPLPPASPSPPPPPPPLPTPPLIPQPPRVPRNSFPAQSQFQQQNPFPNPNLGQQVPQQFPQQFPPQVQPPLPGFQAFGGPQWPPAVPPVVPPVNQGGVSGNNGQGLVVTGEDGRDYVIQDPQPGVQYEVVLVPGTPTVAASQQPDALAGRFPFVSNILSRLG